MIYHFANEKEINGSMDTFQKHYIEQNKSDKRVFTVWFHEYGVLKMGKTKLCDSGSFG